MGSRAFGVAGWGVMDRWNVFARTVRDYAHAAVCTVFVVIALSMDASSGRCASDPVQDTPDASLVLMEQQAESLDTLDVITETQISTDSVTKTVKTRMLMDKPHGRMKIQTFGAQDHVTAEIMIDGSEVYLRGPGVPWKKLALDPQTQKSLESMGASFGAASGGGLAGLDKSDGAALAAVAQPASEPASVSGPAEAVAASDLPLLKQRHWSKAHRDRAQKRIQKRLKAAHAKQSFERLARNDDEGKHWKALHSRYDKANKHRPYDDEVVKLDSNTGQAMERVQFIRASRFPGGPQHVPKGSRLMEQVAPGTDADSDDPLVELGHTKVLRAHEQGGAVVQDESESVSHSYLGTVVMHSQYHGHKVNEPVDPAEFDRSK